MEISTICYHTLQLLLSIIKRFPAFTNEWVIKTLRLYFLSQQKDKRKDIQQIKANCIKSMKISNIYATFFFASIFSTFSHLNCLEISQLAKRLTLESSQTISYIISQLARFTTQSRARAYLNQMRRDKTTTQLGIATLLYTSLSLSLSVVSLLPFSSLSSGCQLHFECN